MTEIARPFVSVIVPVLNDAEALCGLLRRLEPAEAMEVVVVDAGRCDAPMNELQQQFRWCRLRSRPGRGIQMNTGAGVARGTWLLFLHADTRPPADWIAEIRRMTLRPARCGVVFRSDSTALTGVRA